jgi:NADPH:quinone reductase
MQTMSYEQGKHMWIHTSSHKSHKQAVPAAKAVKIPDAIDFDVACAAMIQGLTAHFLASSTYPLKHGDTALVLAGAGGVGQLLIQIAKLRGARVITTVSTPDKVFFHKTLNFSLECTNSSFS